MADLSGDDTARGLSFQCLSASTASVPYEEVFKSIEVAHMRALLLVFMTTAVVPTAWASECFSIQNADQRNACLASAKRDKSYCYKIRDADLREGCLASIQGETYGCFKI